MLVESSLCTCLTGVVLFETSTPAPSVTVESLLGFESLPNEVLAESSFSTGLAVDVLSDTPTPDSFVG